ncbi:MULTISPECIES: TetR/AcrR family transcriptional regulator [unclassified Mycolicibacterium]|uniref:TetR/AcrR family transcriptional regulator n=1 Tax=unclassified Mycolicibacterium TaxID=2636767 RepID=UPI0012DFD17A|nr:MULTISPECIES: TetR/AcrR family transcriptional regulator [unclassified Mycolicibacterium]MUL82834.1 TetR/AcrR family transcriptional regulator [Mycolicibacterium sp. CBMA 329]MUL89169.1 TetR/AcrR family transcriptional regulator [Mycolicibacterium sp. CBMA 331]MUL97736.1 TetR/AcrR family transcriptional regulator [Mycolicibacterium sp. CBMA 334]MUM25151.1 TetR/AcrR family transcriptional regulator [Mycolicibacterium sp. CBMA 295]MUM38685.1 TetR/AcrR family transcriptional regulator [Mycolic
MVGVVSRESYFETGLEVLSDRGYGGLKLAEVCNRLGVTTGSFYHYFPNWASYTRELIAHWREARTLRVVEAVRADQDPHHRIQTLIGEALALPHGAEAAIRVWSSLDPDVYTVQAVVDQLRFDILFESALELVGDERNARYFAAWGVYLIVGFEQTTLPRDTDTLQWITSQMRDALESGRFTPAAESDQPV